MVAVVAVEAGRSAGVTMEAMAAVVKVARAGRAVWAGRAVEVKEAVERAGAAMAREGMGWVVVAVRAEEETVAAQWEVVVVAMMVEEELVGAVAAAMARVV